MEKHYDSLDQTQPIVDPFGATVVGTKPQQKRASPEQSRKSEGWSRWQPQKIRSGAVNGTSHHQFRELHGGLKNLDVEKKEEDDHFLERAVDPFILNVCNKVNTILQFINEK